MTEKKTGLELLRAPFEAKHIGKLPKPLKWQTDAYKKDKATGGQCDLCGAWHHKSVIHLDYVGHAALTDRLLDCDPKWTWKPVAFTEQGLPAFDNSGGLWIELTVMEVTRYGYGHAAGSEWKDIGAREKEVIGDALRNAAMRFGAALDLWHKGDLHDDTDEQPKKKEKLKGPLQRTALNTQIKAFVTALLRATSVKEYNSVVKDYILVTKQARDELPELLTEKGPENFPSVDEQATKKLHSLKSEEEVERQQREDTEYRKDFE